MTTLEMFKQRLQSLVKIDLELVVNENRWTMLNMLERKNSFAKVSVHKMFLEAPDTVVSAIAHYVRGTKKQERNLILKEFIHSHLNHSDYTHLLKAHKLTQAGQVYDLQKMYDALNHHYFEGKLDLTITWFGTVRKRRRRKITFGQYVSGLRLIKIHRMLDDPFFPEYFVAFIIYHEMLHNVVPGVMDSNGRLSIHSRAFKERERAFADYHKAISWEKQHKEKLFN